MNIARSTPTQQRKLARLISVMWLVLAWIGRMFFTDDAPIRRRHMRSRYRWLDLNYIARVIACLVVARAVDFAPYRPVWKRQLRNHARAGFRRIIAHSHVRRTLIGSRLRKALKHPDIAQRFARLAHVLANIDAYARRLAHRLRNGRTRACPILPIRPPHAPLRSVAPVCALEAADSS